MYPVHTPSGIQEVVTVTEKGLYRLIHRSDKPQAERFRDWVFGEVLPSIRKHGCYPPPDAKKRIRMRFLRTRRNFLSARLTALPLGSVSWRDTSQEAQP